MTPSQKILMRRAQIEARLSNLNGVANRSAEQDAEILALTEEFRDLPHKLEAALAAEETDGNLRADGAAADPFAATAGLAAQCSVGEFFGNLYEKKPHDGALAELQSHLGLGRNDLPIDLLRGAAMAAVTAAPTNVRRNEMPVVQPVFADGDSAFLAIDMPTVEAGDATFPILTTRPAVGGPHTDSTAVAETDGAFSAEVLQPSRLQAAFSYRRTDATRFPQMDMALRQALASGLSEALDVQVVSQIVTDVTRTAAAAADDFDSYRKRLVYDRIDGRFANMESDLRILVGSPTLADMSALFRSTTNDISAVESIRRLAGGVKVSPHIAAVAASKQDSIVRRGMRRDMVCPLWRGVTVIFDEVTRSAEGEIKLTALLQFAKKVIRTDGFARVQTQHA